MAPRPPASGLKILAIIGAIFGGFFLLICGVGGWFLYSRLDQFGGGPPVAELPPRVDAWAVDADRFNEGLDRIHHLPNAEANAEAVIEDVDGEIQKFVRKSIRTRQDYDEIPFSQPMFFEAIKTSKQSEGEFSIIDKLSLYDWMTEGVPQPESKPSYRILGIHREPNAALAKVDILFYSTSDQAESHQWFLVKEKGQWKTYDWQSLEDGRPLSDEYAEYLRGEPGVSEGFDLATEELSDLSMQWYNDNDAAIESLRLLESKPMLRGDRPIAKIRMACVWLQWNEFEEAIRLLKTIGTPDNRWGVWPLLASAHVSLGQLDEASGYVEKMRGQSPHHPNVHYLMSEIHNGRNQSDAAADAALAGLKICPEDARLLANVVNQERPSDLPELLSLLGAMNGGAMNGGAMDGENEGNSSWSTVLYRATYSPAWGEALLKHLPDAANAPAGVTQIVAGHLAWSVRDFDAAATQYLAAMKLATSESLKSSALENYLNARLQNDRYREIFDESDDLDATLKSLTEMAFQVELDGEPEELLSVLESHPGIDASPWRDSLLGWARFETDRLKPARESLERFARWVHGSDANLDEDSNWIASSADFYLASVMLADGDPGAVLDRWPGDSNRHDQIADSVLESGNEALAEAVLKRVATTPIDSLELLKHQLLADQSMRRGDIDSCEDHHRRAVQMATSMLEDEGGYGLYPLWQRRIRDLVWNRQWETLADVLQNEPMEEENRSSRITMAVDAIAVVQDVTGFGAMAKVFSASGLEADESRASFDHSVGEAALNAGKNEIAVQGLQRSLDATDSDRSWQFSQRRQTLVKALLRSGLDERALRYLHDTAVEEESTIPPEATLDWKNGDHEKLLAHLSLATADAERDSNEAEPDEWIGDWIADPSQAQWLRRDADSEWMQNLIQKYPLPIQYVDTPASGTLLFDVGVEFSSAKLESFFERAMSGEWTLQPFTAYPINQDVRSWLASNQDGQSWIVRSFPADVKFRNANAELQSKLASPVAALALEVVDDGINPVPRLFQVAETVVSTLTSTLAKDQVIGFYYLDESLWWPGPNLAESLRWQKRLPVHGRVLESSPIEIEPSTTTQTPDEMDIHQWQSRFAATKEPLQALITLKVGDTHEAIECEVTRIDVEDYQTWVRPKTRSVLAPWIRPDVSYRCGAYSLKPMPSAVD